MDSKKSLPLTLLLTALINTGIAGFLYMIGLKGDFWALLVLSQAVGLFICLASWSAPNWFGLQSAWAQVAAVVLGAMGGSVMGLALVWRNLSATSWSASGELFRILAMGLVFGAIVTYYFISRQRISSTETALRDAELRHLASEKQALEANLRVLRGQLEPHFLFNTLSNVLSLIDTDPPRGKLMLQRFTDYLRATLGGSRSTQTTLQEEVGVIEAYIDVLKTRMGDRLAVEIDIPAQLKQMTLPVMLLQPLVENAIEHGIDRTLDGGVVRIAATVPQQGRLELRVEDTGAGLEPSATNLAIKEHSHHMGLANVRDTLATRYGASAALRLEQNQPRGVRAIVTLPQEAADG
jgi:LytS/YehU family sensor histidine kinase